MLYVIGEGAAALGIPSSVVIEVGPMFMWVLKSDTRSS